MSDDQLTRDVDAVVDRLTTSEVEVVWDNSLPGYHRCYVADPWGNRLELLTPQTS